MKRLGSHCHCDLHTESRHNDLGVGCHNEVPWFEVEDCEVHYFEKADPQPCPHIKLEVNRSTLRAYCQFCGDEVPVALAVQGYWS